MAETPPWELDYQEPWKLDYEPPPSAPVNPTANPLMSRALGTVENLAAAGARAFNPFKTRGLVETLTGGALPLPESLSKPLFKIIPELTPEQIRRITTPSVQNLPPQVVTETPTGIVSKPREAPPAPPSEKAIQIATGIEHAGADLGNFFASPIGILSLGTGALPAAAQRATALAFSAQMAKDVPDIAKELGTELGKPEDQRDYAKISKLAANAVANTTFAALGAAHGLAPEKPATPVAQPKETDARIIETPTEVHGDVLPQPLEGERQVPVKEGELRVQPQTEGRIQEEKAVTPTVVDEPTGPGESARFTTKLPEGYATGFIKEGKAELVGIEVEKAARRQGVGERLLRNFSDKAQQSGATAITGDFVPAAKALMDKVFGKPVSEAPVEDWPEGMGPAPIRAEYSIKSPEVASTPSLEAIGSMSGEQFFNTGEQWSQDAMAGKGKSLQVRAEQAAIDNPDIGQWLKQSEALNSKRESIMGDIRKDPPKMMEKQKELMGLAQKQQFLNEGLKIIRGQKVPEKQVVPAQAIQRPTGRGLQLKQSSPSMSQAGAINLGIAHDLFDAASDKADLFSKIASGHSAPKTSHASEASGNALVRYASANQAAPYLARSMTSEVLGPNRKNVEFRQRLGAVLVEDRLRAIKKGLVDALTQSTDPKEQATLKKQIGNVNSLVGQGKFFADEGAFRDAVADPDISQAIQRHKDTVQKTAELYHQETGGQLAGPGLVTGAFVNLEALHEDIPGMVFGKGAQGDYSRPFKKKTVFGQKALGSASKYELDYDRLAERMIRGNFEEYSKRQMYDQLQKDGLAVLLEPGMPRPDIGEKPAVKFQIERRGQPWGGTKVENLWVRSDIAPEVRQALNIEGPIKDAAAAKVANVINKIQLAGPTDAIWHSANIINSIAGQQGGKTFLSDLARKVPGVNYADAMVRIGKRARDVMRDDPSIVKELSDLAQIGATRPESLNATGPMSRMISLLDKAGRLVRNDLYNNLVERNIIEPSEASRREFVNKIGQYNPRLMGRFQRFFKEAGISPFVVAGRNFNRQAFQKATLNPGFKAATVGAAAQARALEAFGVMATLIAVPAFLNQLSVGNPNGRKGVPFGMVDTGKNDSKGNPIVVDPAQWTGLRRGMRLTGMNAVLNGIKAGKSARQIESDAGRDIKSALIHPWSGPAAQAATVAATGYTPTGFKESEDPGDYSQNVLGALKNLNPVVHSALKDNLGTSIGGAFGIKSVSPRSSFQEIKSRAQDWGLKNRDPKIKQHYEALAKSQFPAGAFSEVRTELRTGDREKIVLSVNKILSLEPDTAKQNARMKQILKEFQPFVVNDDGSGHVKPFATDSKAHEKAFLQSQGEEGKALWRAALKERVADYRKLTEALYGTPRNPPIPEQYRSEYGK